MSGESTIADTPNGSGSDAQMGGDGVNLAARQREAALLMALAIVGAVLEYPLALAIKSIDRGGGQRGNPVSPGVVCVLRVDIAIDNARLDWPIQPRRALVRDNPASLCVRVGTSAPLGGFNVSQQPETSSGGIADATNVGGN